MHLLQGITLSITVVTSTDSIDHDTYTSNTTLQLTIHDTHDTHDTHATLASPQRQRILTTTAALNDLNARSITQGTATATLTSHYQDLRTPLYSATITVKNLTV